MIRRSLAMLLVIGQLTLTLSGCVSVTETGSHPASGAGGGVSVKVFADDGARRDGRPSPPGILGELERQDAKNWAPVFRSLNPTWTVVDLPPGSYRLRFPARLDEAGNVVRLGDKVTDVTVKEGSVTEVQAVLDHVSTGLVVAGVVTVVAIAAILAKEGHHGLPVPPPPPPGLADVVFHVSIGVTFVAGSSEAGPALPPVVTSHFPTSAALVAARRPRVLFSMSEPLRPTEVKGDGVTVLGEASGLVPGQVSYDPEHWWVVWEPRTDLAPGDTFHVTLGQDGVEGVSGKEMEKAESFTFKTAR
ncbi:MAG: Ig-like domain-containing protein [Thermoanaerobaculaceae bacterium]